MYKQRGKERWRPDEDRKNCAIAVVYTENLPEVLKGTAYQYCALDIFQKKRGCNPIPVWRFMDKYPKKTYLEFFLKSGLINLATDISNNEWDVNINEKGNTPAGILGIPKNYIPILRAIDGDSRELKLLQQCAADKVLPAAEDIHEFCEKFGSNEEMLEIVNANMSIRKFIGYMDKQRNKLPKHKEIPCSAWGSPKKSSMAERIKEGYKNLASDWMDYIKWCKELKYNMQDMYVLLPPDFGKAHDRVMKEHQEWKDAKMRKQQEKMEKQIKEILAAAEGIPGMAMQAKGLTIILPKSGDEIKEEGRALHHCVGGYVERVAKGETMILFVRKVSAQDVPYYTMEYRDGKVVQCRGKNNCSMTKDVQAFVKAFERKMQQTEKFGKKRKAG